MMQTIRPCYLCKKKGCGCIGSYDVHWRMRSVLRHIRDGDLDALAHDAQWNPNGGTADMQEFNSADFAADELLRLAKIGQKAERKKKT